MSNPKPVELRIIGLQDFRIQTEFVPEKIMHGKEEIDHVRIDLTMEALLDFKEKIDSIIRRLDVEEHK